MVVGSNSSGTAENRSVLLQEIQMTREHIRQKYNPDHLRDSCQQSRNSETNCTNSAARRKPSARRRKGNSPKRKNGVTPSAAPHGHVESRRSGRGQFGTVRGLREKDNAVGCNALEGNFPKARRAAEGGVRHFNPGTLPGKRHGGHVEHGHSSQRPLACHMQHLAPSAVQTALHVWWIGAQRWNGNKSLKKSGIGPARRRSPRDMAGKTTTSSGRPVLAGLRRRFVQLG